ncbi:MAG: hypothetical protein AB7S99_06545 [Pseudodonghicola sp.]
MVNYVAGKSPNYWWPVVVRRPDPETPGHMVEQTFTALLVPKGQDELLEEAERIQGIMDLRKRMVAEREALAAKVAGWRDILDADGELVPFSRDALIAELQKPEVRTGIYRAIAESASGEEARLGN